MRNCWLGLVALTVLTASASLARADDAYPVDTWPTEVILRPLTLAEGMFELRGTTAFVNLSNAKAFQPIDLEPALFYGLTDKLTIGISHGRELLGPAAGLCVSGTDNGCARRYNNLNLVGYYSLEQGQLAIAAHPSLEVLEFSPIF